MNDIESLMSTTVGSGDSESGETALTSECWSVVVNVDCSELST